MIKEEKKLISSRHHKKEIFDRQEILVIAIVIFSNQRVIT